MYESMVYWETANPQIPINFAGGEQPEVMQKCAQIWQNAGKIVYSRTLQEVSSGKTRIERELNPDLIRKLKESSKTDITISSPNLAGQALKAGLVDEYHLLVYPIILGGGKQALPDNLRIQLELLGEHLFQSGVVHLHYRVKA